MTGLTPADSQRLLDLGYPAGATSDAWAWSADGSTETSALARTAVGSWAAATLADPSVKGNAAELVSAAATAAVTITHGRLMSAASGGTPRSDWQALATARVLAIGEQITFAVGEARVTET